MVIGFVGGGTGGHFYPLMAVAHELNQTEEQPKLYYFGPSPYNQEQLAHYNITHVYTPAGKLRRYFSIQNFFDVFKNLFGVPIAIWRLFIIYPDVIFSKGGYTAVPILLAAKFLRIPVVIHESDSVPGTANKLAVKYARYIGVAYDDAAQFFPPEKTALIGIPMRPEIKQIPADPFAALGLPNDRPLIYVTGGSLGAERLNDAILSSLRELLPHYTIFHQTGAANLEEFRYAAQTLLQGTDLAQHYYLEGTISAEQVSALMAAATLVITRAGSTTLFEIAYHAKPSIIVPIPEDVSRDQRSNAYAFARGGGASVIEQHNLTSHLLAEEIRSIIDNPERQAEMSAAARRMFVDDAARKVANVLISIGTEHGS